MDIFKPVGIECGSWYKTTYPADGNGKAFFVEIIIDGDCYGRYRNGRKSIYNWQWLTPIESVTNT